MVHLRGRIGILWGEGDDSVFELALQNVPLVRFLGPMKWILALLVAMCLLSSCATAPSGPS